MPGRVVIVLIVALLLWYPQAVAAKRVAIVIANSRYASVAALRNPPADAKLIADALKKARFDSVEVKYDLDLKAMAAALQQFSGRAEGADVALIYFAGHGIEAGGQNYLIPTDAKLIRDRDLDIEATRLDTVLAMGEGARMRIIVLDACRNNPFLASMTRSVRTRSVGRGLAAIEPDGETLVVYAAKAGAFAEDGEGGNSPFASALARRLPEPGLEIGLLFRAVRDDVLKQTGRAQEPFTYGSLSGTAFYFVPPGAVAVQQAGAAPSPAPAPLPRPLAPPQAQAQARPQMSPRPKTPPPRLGGTGAAAGFVVPGTQPRFQSPYGAIDVRELMSRPIKLAPLANAAPAEDGDTTRGRFEFQPSAIIRRDVKALFLENMRKDAPDIANALAGPLETSDIFGDIDKMVDLTSLSATNGSDALARFIVYVMQMQSGEPGTSRQDLENTRAVSQQIALILMRDPNFNNLGHERLQILSDMTWLNTWLINNTFKRAGRLNAQARASYARAMMAGLQASFGVDFSKLTITSKGLVGR